MTGRPPPGRIVVLGGGQVALLAACAVRRALPGADVRLVPTPIPPDALADRSHGTLPAIARLHARIGIDAMGLVARAGASHRLATRHGGDWGEWWIGHGAAVDPADHGFVAGWSARSGAEAMRASGPAVALAQRERFAEAADDPASPLSDLDHGLRWSPEGYRRHLTALARHLGVAIEPGVAEADPAGIDADLVIDARGVPGGDRIDWRDALPIDRVVFEAGPPALSVADRLDLTGDALRLTSPGRDATRVVTMRRGGDGVAIAPGRRRAAWEGRVVTIGDGAAMLPPLGQANLLLAALAIELLIELLPGRDIHPLERAEWNRRWALAADATRDFASAHLVRLSEDHPLRARASDALALRIAGFARRARVPALPEDPFPRDMWTQLLAGIGVVPGESARVRAADPRAAAAARTLHEARIGQAVALAKPYPLWLGGMMGEGR